jgi:hypothetical protein
MPMIVRGGRTAFQSPVQRRALAHQRHAVHRNSLSTSRRRRPSGREETRGQTYAAFAFLAGRRAQPVLGRKDLPRALYDARARKRRHNAADRTGGGPGRHYGAVVAIAEDVVELAVRDIE